MRFHPQNNQSVSALYCRLMIPILDKHILCIPGILLSVHIMYHGLRWHAYLQKKKKGAMTMFRETHIGLSDHIMMVLCIPTWMNNISPLCYLSRSFFPRGTNRFHCLTPFTVHLLIDILKPLAIITRPQELSYNHILVQLRHVSDFLQRTEGSCQSSDVKDVR